MEKRRKRKRKGIRALFKGGVWPSGPDSPWPNNYFPAPSLFLYCPAHTRKNPWGDNVSAKLTWLAPREMLNWGGANFSRSPKHKVAVRRFLRVCVCRSILLCGDCSNHGTLISGVGFPGVDGSGLLFSCSKGCSAMHGMVRGSEELAIGAEIVRSRKIGHIGRRALVQLIS